MNGFMHYDTKADDGVSVEFECLIVHDPDNSKPDEHDDGFWPSADPNAAGYVEPALFETETAKATTRMNAWKAGIWWYVGVRAKAIIMVRRSGVGTVYELTSPGLWGIESDSDESYLASVFENECEILRNDLAMIGAHFKPKDWKWAVVERSGMENEDPCPDKFDSFQDACKAMYSAYTDVEIEMWPVKIAVDRGDGNLSYDY